MILRVGEILYLVPVASRSPNAPITCTSTAGDNVRKAEGTSNPFCRHADNSRGRVGIVNVSVSRVFEATGRSNSSCACFFSQNKTHFNLWRISTCWHFCPTNPPKVGNPKHLERNNDVLRNNGWAFFHVVKSFFYLARWLDKMLGGAMFNNLEQGTVTSLQKQGAANRHHGIKSRPKLIHQSQVIQEITSFRQAGGRFSGVTEWPFDTNFWLSLHICE